MLFFVWGDLFFFLPPFFVFVLIIYPKFVNFRTPKNQAIHSERAGVCNCKVQVWAQVGWARKGGKNRRGRRRQEEEGESRSFTFVSRITLSSLFSFHLHRSPFQTKACSPRSSAAPQRACRASRPRSTSEGSRKTSTRRRCTRHSSLLARSRCVGIDARNSGEGHPFSLLWGLFLPPLRQCSRLAWKPGTCLVHVSAHDSI